MKKDKVNSRIYSYRTFHQQPHQMFGFETKQNKIKQPLHHQIKGFSNQVLDVLWLEKIY